MSHEPREAEARRLEDAHRAQYHSLIFAQVFTDIRVL